MARCHEMTRWARSGRCGLSLVMSILRLPSAGIRQLQAVSRVFNPTLAHGLFRRLPYLVDRKRIDLYPFLEFFLVQGTIRLEYFQKFERETLGMRNVFLVRHTFDV